MLSENFQSLLSPFFKQRARFIDRVVILMEGWEEDHFLPTIIARTTSSFVEDPQIAQLPDGLEFSSIAVPKPFALFCFDLFVPEVCTALFIY